MTCRWLTTSSLQESSKDIRLPDFIEMDTFLGWMDRYVSNRFMVEPTLKMSHHISGGIMSGVFRNSVLSSHHHAAP